MSKVRVLGVSLGTRKVGIAVIEHRALHDCLVRNFPGIWSEQKEHAIIGTISRFIKTHSIEHIALKIPPAYSHSHGISELIGRLTGLCRKLGGTLSIFTYHQLKKEWL